MNFNAYWYIGLALISASLLVYIYFRTRNSTLFLIFLGMIGTGYLIEFVIYILLGSYVYYPKLILRDAYYDSNVGAIASNVLALPVSAAVISVLRLNWVWIIGTACLFYGIEWLFAELGIFRHHWWKSIYTATGLLFYFSFAKHWYERMLRPMKGVILFVTLFFMTGALMGTLQFMPIALFDSKSYTIGWFDNPSRDTTAAATIFWLGVSLIYVSLLSIPWRRAWPQYAISITLLIVLEFILRQTRVMHSHVWWDLYYCIFCSLVVLTSSEAIRKRLKKGPPRA